MELPEDVLRLVKEYAQPLTRPDWRTLHRMPRDTFMEQVYRVYRYRFHKKYDEYLKYKPYFNCSNFKLLFPDHWMLYIW
jgi:hypothetical protein